MPDKTGKFIELASLLSDNDSEFLAILELYANGRMDEFWDEIDSRTPSVDDQEYFRQSVEDEGIEAVIKQGLITFGYIGSNDWKFPLEDMLFNAEKSFAHYGIDVSIYENIPNKDEIVAPEALKLIVSRLPEGFGMGMWDFGSDSYELIIARTQTLETAAKLADELGLQIYADCSREY